MTHAMGPGYPWGTLAANLLGGLAMWLLVGVLGRFIDGGEAIRLLLAVGVLGGFTTFSSFSLEVMLMLERGQMVQGLGYRSEEHTSELQSLRRTSYAVFCLKKKND